MSSVRGNGDLTTGLWERLLARSESCRLDTGLASLSCRLDQPALCIDSDDGLRVIHEEGRPNPTKVCGTHAPPRALKSLPSTLDLTRSVL